MAAHFLSTEQARVATWERARVSNDVNQFMIIESLAMCAFGSRCGCAHPMVAKNQVADEQNGSVELNFSERLIKLSSEHLLQSAHISYASRLSSLKKKIQLGSAATKKNIFFFFCNESI